MNSSNMFRDPLIDGHELQQEFEAEIQEEYESGFPLQEEVAQIIADGNDEE